MAEKVVKLPTPHKTQHLIVNEATRFNVVAMGEQAGKTTLGVEVLLAGPRGALKTRKPVAWFSATEEELALVRRDTLARIEPLIRKKVDAHTVELSNGNTISFYSLEKRKDINTQFGLIVVDNACKAERLLDYWDDVLSHCLRENAGSAWFISGTFGKQNDFYRLFQYTFVDDDWTGWQFPSKCNPHLSKDIKKAMAAAPNQEFQQRYGAQFLDVAFQLSSSQKVLKPDETFIQWCERLEGEGLKVDGHPFTLSDRPAMRFIYEQIPSTVEEAFGKTTVIMKCTQVGFTVMEMLAMIYLALRFSPAKIGMFMPSQMLASGKSSKRFMPIVRTVPDVYNLMVTKKEHGGKGDEGNVLTREMGESLFHFLWTSGKTATESFPMDVISFDEVQEMAIADMEKTKERLSASKLRYTLMGSTANWPDSDIHWWYKRGTQHQFHTKCPHCGAGHVLDDHFPDCVGYDPETRDYRYRCISCRGWISDSQAGDWIAKDPEARITSVHFPQFLSPTISAREIIEAYHNADDMKNFFNRKLGKPYTDPSQVPVNLEMLNECAELGMAAGLVWKTSAYGTFMGIDQMGAFNVVIIKERMRDGRQAVIHLEYIFNPDPFDRCDDLMEQYGVQCCVVETLPNYNDAKRFAQRHLGKVFLAGYGKIEDEMMRWGDTPKFNASDRRTSDEERDQYTVTLDQYKCMQVSMARFQKRMCLFPDPKALVQEVLEKGQRKMVPVCKDLAFLHFTRTALIAEQDEEEKKFKRRVVKVGLDPHTSYANMLCDIAWARAFGTSTFLMPDVDAPKELQGETRAVVEAHHAGVKAIEQINLVNDSNEATCGRCRFRDPETNRCREIQATVRPQDPSCLSFEGRR